VNCTLHSPDREVEALHPHILDVFPLESRDDWHRYVKAVKLADEVVLLTMLVQRAFKLWYLDKWEEPVVFVCPDANESEVPYSELETFSHANILCYICEERMNVLAKLKV